MNNRTFSVILFTLFPIIVLSVTQVTACTIFTVVSGDEIYFGNNEDYKNPNTYIWFAPDIGKYGGAYLGYDLDHEKQQFSFQGGINEKGLAFDANALPRMALKYHHDRKDADTWLVLKMLQECATVTEAIELAKEYNWGTIIKYQLHLADATGDAVVISAGTDQELNFTRKNSGNGYLVSTNFNVGYTKNGNYPCQRYDTAMEMLAEVDKHHELTINYSRDILDEVHAEGTSSTLYTNIFDLKNLKIYLYYFHQFNEVVEIDLIKELAKGDHNYRIKELFSQDTQDRAAEEYAMYQELMDNNTIPGFFSDITLFGLSSIFLFRWIKRRSEKNRNVHSE